MAAPTQFVISRPVMVLTDYLEGTGYSSSIGLAFQAGSLSAMLASGSPTTVRGASMSLPNLLQLVDTSAATGRAPFFSLPLEAIPEFMVPIFGSIQLGAVIKIVFFPSSTDIDGTFDVRIETDTRGVTHIRIHGTQDRTDEDYGVRVVLGDGLEIGATRLDEAGRAWLDLNFLSLFSAVTEGAVNINIAFNASEPSGRFYLRFSGLPITFADSSVLELQASVVLDPAPNFAPRLDLGNSATLRDYSAKASQPLKFGENFFFGADFQVPVSAALPGGLDLADPIENLTVSASIPSTTYDLWSPPASGFRPVLMARPLTGTVQIDGVGVTFPSADAVPVNIDTITNRTAAGAGSAQFVRFGADVYRALTFNELAGLQFTGTAQQALQHPEADISFLIRDAQGALSTEYVARMHLQTARLSGLVSHWVGGEPLQGVRVALARDTGYGATEPAAVSSAPDGQWQIEGLDFTRFAATAQRAADAADVGRAVGAADVLAALKLATGRSHTAAATEGSSSDPAAIRQAAIAKLAADFNGDGQLEVQDAASILRVVTGQTTAGSLGWRFVAFDQAGEPSDAVQIDATAASRLDWLGFLIGDVDGSWHSAANGQVM